MKTEKEILDYISECQKKHGTFPRLRGHFPFEVLIKNNLITPHLTMIRVLYSEMKDICYFVDEGGLLYREDDFDNSFEPSEILSESMFPDGWEPLMLKRVNSL